MLIRERGPFLRGVLMLAVFFVLLAALFMRVFHDENGKPLTGLEYADNVFNRLSKGSSYFIPEVRKSVETVAGSMVELSVTLKKEDLAPMAAAALNKAGVREVSVEGATLKFSGDLGQILSSATDDGDALYHNNGDAVSRKYGGEQPLKAAAAWWHLLSPALKELQKQRLLREAKVVDQVIRRALEPGNNFYSIQPVRVSDHVLLLSGLLLFYLFYTLWYGFAIFELFEGLGLAMSKGRDKRE